MKLVRLVVILGSLPLLGGGLSSCLKEPNYSSTPEISFDNIRVGRNYPLLPNGQPDTQGQPTDSVFVTVRYQDGEGDLGILPNVNTPANYFIEPYLKNTATRKFEATADKGITVRGAYNGIYPPVSTLTTDKAAPLKGTLTRKLFFNYGDVFTAGQTVRFTVSIADRAGHISNTITTDSIVIKPR